jgi:hypothetical protein
MRKALIIILSIVVVIGIVLFLLRQWSPTSYDPNDSRDLQKLSSIADNSRPFREALEKFKHDHGIYPQANTNIFPSYLIKTDAPDDFSDWAGWRYFPGTNSYTLFYQVNWDDGLWYDHLVNGTNQWYYSTSTTQIDLTQKFQQR